MKQFFGSTLAQWTIGIVLILAGTYVSWLISPDPIQIVAAITGLACVWLCAKESIWNYPIGIVNIILLIVLFFGVQLYADFTLNIIFLILNIFGWYYWLTNRGQAKVRKTTNATKKEIITAIVVVIVGTPIWGFIFTHLGAALPYADSFVMVASIVAQWFLSKKILQTWYFWIAVDLVAVPIYFIKDLPLIAILYIVYLGICVNGLISWKKEFKTINGGN